MYLLDTNILSASAPTRRDADADAEALAAWMRAHSDRLYLSAITIAEIEAGIARAIRIGASAKAPALRRWLAAVEHFYARRTCATLIVVVAPSIRTTSWLQSN